ncbi:MAG: ribosome small subunit-dependent GTPase A [Nakamurella sp.]
MSTLGENWDNDDVRVRPTRSSRPRTKTRPTHTDAVTGFVTTVDRGRYTCLVEEGSKRTHVVTAMRARELGRRAVAVGDVVDLVGDTDGNPDTLARIVRISPRRSVLRRSADDTDPAERVLVANADQLVIVCALADPVPRTGFIDRCLVAAYTGNLDAVLVLTKSDLADPAPLAAIYADLELPILVTSRGVAADGTRTVEGIDAVRQRLDRSVSVMIGHSGVGKSTLVNALVPDAKRATGSVTGVGKGRHTSTSAIALPLRAGGWVIDTPGVRSFGLAHVTPDDLLETFDDLLPGTVTCPPNCDHTGADGGVDTTGVGCALDAYVAAGNSSLGRLASFRRLLASRAGSDDSIRDDATRDDATRDDAVIEDADRDGAADPG